MRDSGTSSAEVWMIIFRPEFFLNLAGGMLFLWSSYITVR